MQFRRLLIPATLLIIALSLLVGVRSAAAQDEGGDEGDGRSPFDQRCLACHGDATETATFQNGDERSIDVDVDAFDHSVHGLDNPQAGLSCYDCHGSFPFPHEATFESDRDFRLALNEACTSCHSYEGGLQADSVHAQAMAEGNQNAAVCVDCHGYHDVAPPDEPRSRISITCGNCHTDIFEQYENSIHGAALLEESNPDVPTCVDCHGVHNIENPTTNLFRLRSPDICAQCHANDELMEKYGISTNVFNSYVSDFHGTTVTLFQHEAPDAEVNKAVCYDCHGVHNILPPDDPNSTVAQENLLATCQRCHPDASEGFDAAWTKHYEPSRDKYPLVYFVDLFYKIFIPGILAFFGVVMVPDIVRRFVSVARGGGHDHTPVSSAASTPVDAAEAQDEDAAEE